MNDRLVYDLQLAEYLGSYEKSEMNFLGILLQIPNHQEI